MNEAQKSALEICDQAERRIREAQRMLIDPRRETLDSVQSELAEVIGGLRGLGRSLQPELRAPLQRIRAEAGTLSRQIEHASNLYMGYMQLRVNHGYTRQGMPMVHTRAGNSVEA